MSLSSDRLTSADRAISALYDAAAGISGWETALSATAAACQGDGAVIFSRALGFDPRAPTASADVDPQSFLSAYLANFRYRDPWAERLERLGQRMTGVFRSEGIVPDAELQLTPHYNEVFKKHDVRRLLSVGVDGRAIEGTPEIILSVTRGVQSQDYNEEDESVIRLLAPHIDAAVNLNLRVRAQTLNDITALLDFADGGLAILTRGRRLVHANAVFRAFLASSPALHLSDGSLSFIGAAQIVEAACDAILTPGLIHERRPRFFKVRIARDATQQHALLVAPLPAQIGVALRFREPLAIVKLMPRPGPLDSMRNAFAEAHGLSPAESRLVGHLIAGLSLEAAAQLSGISVQTARSQLKIVFAKTRTRRQGELVAYVLTAFDASLRLRL